MAATQGPNKKLQALCQNLQIFQARKAEIVDGLSFLKENLERRNVHPDSDEYRRTLLHHNSRLQHCETTIRNVQKEVEEEFQKATHREIEIRGQLEKEYAEFEQLQDQERAICRNVQYYSFIASLLRLGPLGLDTLLYKLRYSGVDMVGEAKVSSFVPSRDGWFD
jgi:TolA-binding protein